MQETNIVRGSLKVVGLVHGAVNALVTLDFNKPDDWEFKQFISQDQLEQFARDNDLVIQQEEKA